MKEKTRTQEWRARERLAKRIADELMTNGSGDKAARLQLRGAKEQDLGGYCRNAVLAIIAGNLP